MIYPVVTPCPEDPRLWILHETFEVQTPYGLLRIMGGFKFDGLSRPQWPIVALLIGDKMQGRGLAGALGHDGLYSAKLTNRKEADLILLYLLFLFRPYLYPDESKKWRYAYSVYCLKMWLIKSKVMYLFVRAFGWSVWCRRKASSAKAARAFVHLR